MEKTHREILEKAVEYSESKKGFTTDPGTGEMLDTEERAIIEGLLQFVLYLISEK